MRRSQSGLFVILLAATLMLLSGNPAAQRGLPRLFIISYDLVSQAPGADGTEFTFRALLVNTGPAIPGAVATLEGTSAAATVTDGTVSFATTPRWGFTWSSDTFSIRLHGRWRDVIRQLRWVVSVGAPNLAPVANAGADQTVTPGSTVQLDGSLSSDPDGNPLTYAWQIVQQPAGSQAGLDDPTAMRPHLAIDQPGVYTLSLVVNDGQLSSSPDLVELRTDNSPPVANAGADLHVAVGATATLDGSGSSDVDGNQLTYNWTLLSGPGGSTAALSASDSVAPQLIVDVPGTYTVQLVVNDGTVDSQPDTVTISTLNGSPTAHAGPDQTIVAGQVVTLDGSLSSDPDGDGLTYRWQLSSAPGGSLATIANATLPVTTFVADQPGDYAIQLVVNDGQVDSAPDTVVISTTNSAPVADAGADRPDVLVGTTVTLDGSGSRDADGHPLRYAWALLTHPAGSQATLSGATSVAPTFVVDVPGEYVVQLLVNDGFVDSAPDTLRVQGVAPALPEVSIVETDGSASEIGPENGTLTLRRTGDVAAALDVRVLVRGSATNGVDYASIPGVITIPAGASTLAVDIRPVADGDLEGTEGVAITLEPSAAYTIGSPATAQVQIADGSRPTVTIVTTDATASENGLEPGTIVLSRNGPTTAPLPVRLGRSGNAINGTDYVSLGGPTFVADIPAGESSLSLRVLPIADNLVEPTESVVVNLLVSNDYIVGAPDTATITIADDPARVSLETLAAGSERDRQPAVIAVRRAGGATGLPLEVGLTRSGTLSPNDYDAFPAAIMIPAGASQVELVVIPRRDNLVEGTESYFVQVEPRPEYTLAQPPFANLLIADDPPVVSVSATDATAVEGTADVGRFTFVRTGGEPGDAMTVFFTRSGTATNGIDYVSIGGAQSTASFAAGSLTADVVITALADAISEVSETVDVDLSLRANYNIGSPSSATVVIVEPTVTPQ